MKRPTDSELCIVKDDLVYLHTSLDGNSARVVSHAIDWLNWLIEIERHHREGSGVADDISI